MKTAEGHSSKTLLLAEHGEKLLPDEKFQLLTQFDTTLRNNSMKDFHLEEYSVLKFLSTSQPDFFTTVILREEVQKLREQGVSGRDIFLFLNRERGLAKEVANFGDGDFLIDPSYNPKESRPDKLQIFLDILDVPKESLHNFGVEVLSYSLQRWASQGKPHDESAAGIAQRKITEFFSLSPEDIKVAALMSLQRRFSEWAINTSNSPWLQNEYATASSFGVSQKEFESTVKDCFLSLTFKGDANILTTQAYRYQQYAMNMLDSETFFSDKSFLREEAILKSIDGMITDIRERLAKAAAEELPHMNFEGSSLLLPLQRLFEVRHITSPTLERSFTQIHLAESINFAAIFSSISGKLHSIPFGLNYLELAQDDKRTLPLEGRTPLLTSLMDRFQLTTVGEFVTFCKQHPTYLNFLSENSSLQPRLTRADIDIVRGLGLTFLQAELLKQRNIPLQEILIPESAELVIDTFRAGIKEWQDDLLVDSFKEGVGEFGFTRMLRYVNKPRVTLHDILHTFPSIIKLYKESGLNSDQFYGNILGQVRNDDAIYEVGTAYHVFNQVADSIKLDVDAMHSELQVINDNSGEILLDLRASLSAFRTTKDVFSSWNSLRRYSDLRHLLEEQDNLIQLEVLNNDVDRPLYNFLRTLMLHKDSKVNIAAAIQFWRNPDAFFERNASNTPQEAQNKKKPSNYTHVPFLDLTAIELRDAFVRGDIDRIQVFSPHEIQYRVPVINNVPQTSLRNLTKAALGSRQKRDGLARDTGRLFGRINSLLRQHGATMAGYLEGAEGVAPAVEEEILTHVVHKEYGVVVDNWLTLTAKSNLKSDPIAAVSGNDMANCMPFGDGKTTVYMFNPDTGLFTLSLTRDDGTQRTIAQSLLTKDVNIESSVPDAIRGLQAAEANIATILPESVLSQSTSYLACDSVEMAPNYKNMYAGVIQALYEDFFGDYLNRFGVAEGLVQDQVLLGNPIFTGQAVRPNTFAPRAPVSYSDKAQATVHILTPSRNDLAAFRQVRSQEIPDRQKSPIFSPGVASLTFEDSLSVAYLEGKAYQDTALIQHLHNMENGLIGMGIANSMKHRPNMSVKYTKGNGRFAGYIFAYEGVARDTEVSGYTGPLVYVSDIATETSERADRVGIQLMKEFIKRYHQNYINTDNPLPIFAQMRESTSYKLISGGILQRLMKDMDFVFDIEELPTYSEGNDVMHPVLLRPRKVERSLVA